MQWEQDGEHQERKVMPRLGTDNVDALFAKASQLKVLMALFHPTAGPDLTQKT